MQQKTERFEMRLDPATLEKVDDWRSHQTDLPSRAEAMRRLMETGLAGTEKKPVNFSDGERLITLMLCELYKHLKIEGDLDPALIEGALHGGHLWSLEWEYPGIFHGEEVGKQAVYEVGDVLEMWQVIEESYAKLSKRDKERVEKESDPFGKHVVFRGFDGNHESEHLGVAGFLINRLDRFAHFKGRDLNSHMPSIEGYRRMLGVLKPMRDGLWGGGLLGAEQIIDLLNAQRGGSE